MFRLFHFALVVAVVALGAIGISRLSYNVEILDLLPRGMAGVEGTKWFQKVYDRPDQLIITVSAKTDVDADEAVTTLADALMKNAALAKRVHFQPSWEAHPQDMLEMVAFAWLNASPAQVQALEQSLSPAEIATTLKNRVARLGSSLDPMTVAIESNDVLGLTSAMRSGMDTAAMQSMGGGGYSNEDGTFRVLYVDAPKPMSGYRDAATWLAQIKAVRDSLIKPDVKVSYTGNPAFQAEIGSGMENDMSQSVSGITFIVGFLFWLLHRQIKPLFMILASMLATGLITLGIAGLAFGSLNVMSMGFAAILMGMIEDFGVLGLNEAMNRPGESFQQIHKRIFPSIWWSAITSAAVFGALGLSTLPGIAQMGVLTGIGILVGAGVMLYGFLPLAMKLRIPHAPVIDSGKPTRWPGIVIAVLALVCTGTLISRGLPPVANGSSVLRPKHCQSFDALMEFDKAMKPDGDSVVWLPIVIRESDETALTNAIHQANEKLAKAKMDNAILDHYLPAAFAPNPANQAANMTLLLALAGDRERLFKAADAAGFNERGLGLAKGVFDLWKLWAPVCTETTIWPDLVKLDDSLGRQLHRSGTDFIACGFMRIAKSSTAFQAPIIAELQSIPGVHVSGWDYLTSQLKTVMVREVQRVLLPALAVLFVLFFFVFKNWRERVFAVGSLMFSGLILLGGMSLLGMDWNFVNIATIPLCLGLGLDFNIHILYSLRHTEQTGEDDPGVGRALAYCGLSTGLGFGALAMSDNVGLSTFGICAMIGVLATLFVAAFAVPWAWMRLR
jgi:predicted RND superfamily exporter protein